MVFYELLSSGRPESQIDWEFCVYYSVGLVLFWFLNGGLGTVLVDDNFLLNRSFMPRLGGGGMLVKFFSCVLFSVVDSDGGANEVVSCFYNCSDWMLTSGLPTGFGIVFVYSFYSYFCSETDLPYYSKTYWCWTACGVFLTGGGGGAFLMWCRAGGFGTSWWTIVSGFFAWLLPTFCVSWDWFPTVYNPICLIFCAYSTIYTLSTLVG